MVRPREPDVLPLAAASFSGLIERVEAGAADGLDAGVPGQLRDALDNLGTCLAKERIVIRLRTHEFRAERSREEKGKENIPAQHCVQVHDSPTERPVRVTFEVSS